jgi:hypothetical protein
MNNGVTWAASVNTYTSGFTQYYGFTTNGLTTDANATTGWQTNSYSTAGAYTGSTTTSVYKNSTPTTVTGDWIQIQSNVPLIMKSYTMTTVGISSYSLLGRAPGSYTIAGSNDGNSWYDLQDVSFTSLTSSGWSTATAFSTLQTCNSFAVSTATGNLSYANVTIYATQSNAYTYFRFILLKTLNGSFSTGNANAVSQFSWNPIFSPSTSTGPSRTLLYMDASNINQLDVSGSLALVNSNPSTILVSPNTTTATKYTWQNNNVTWITNSSSYELSSPAYPYLAFNNAFIINPGYAIPWVTTPTGYSTSTGAYTALTYGTPNVNQNGTIVNISGEWLQIQSSVPVILKNYFFGTQNAYPAGLPKTYTIIGSNDGTTWYDLQDGNFTAWPGNLLASNSLTSQYTPAYAVSTATTGTISNNSITSYTAQTNAYTFFRLIIKSTCDGQFSAANPSGQVRSFWNPTFSPTSSAVSLALDPAVPNQLNIGGNQLNIGGGLVVSGTANFSGYVGIGTSAPLYPLHIPIQSAQTAGYNGVFAAGYQSLYFNGGNSPTFFNPNSSGGFSSGGGGLNLSATSVSIAALGSIVTNNIIAASMGTSFSDERIKANIQNIDDGIALVELRKLNPKTYTYIDTVKKGLSPYYGFIAQEVETVIPNAVFLLEQYIPNIYEMAKITDGTRVTLTNKSSSDFKKDVSGNIYKNIKFYDSSDNEIVRAIVSVIDDKTFQIADAIDHTDVFVYGQEVPDFRSLDKDAILTITAAAVQQIDREFQEANQTIQTLKSKNNELETRLVAMDARLSRAGF